MGYTDNTNSMYYQIVSNLIEVCFVVKDKIWHWPKKEKLC